MTRSLRRLASLGWQERILLAQAGAVVVVSRVALWTTGMRGARRAVRIAVKATGASDPTRAPWAVKAVSRRIAGASCLTQALALQAMLERAGQRCRVEIGIAKEDSFEAHAWVVCGDVVLIGGAGAAKFQTVMSLD